MSQKPSWQADEAVDDAPAGVVRLARSALASPLPAPEAEHDSREQALAQFRDEALTPRPLHETPSTSTAPALTNLVGRVLRHLLKR